MSTRRERDESNAANSIDRMASELHASILRERRARRWLWQGSGVLAGVLLGLVLAGALMSRPGALLVPSRGALAFAAQAEGRFNSVADVAERTLPSVVNIATTTSARQVASPFMQDPFFREFFRHFEGQEQQPSPRQVQSLGSGVIVSADGLVLTNNHVIKDAEKIRVTLTDKREFVAKVVGKDPKSDVAVVRLQGAKNLPTIPFGDSDRMRLGDFVLAIGNPFGVGQTVTMGIVSAKGRGNLRIVDYEDFIQTDAAINPGNSGGAMINMRGELVGINTAILSRSGGYQGIGFSIPSNMVRPIMDSLVKRGKVIRGWLGVVIQEVSEELAKAMHLPTREGILISDVDPDGPAHRAGLKRGDLLVKLNGEKLTSTRQLSMLVASAGAVAKVKVEFFRDGKKQEQTIALQEMPARIAGFGKDEGTADGSRSRGMALSPLSAELREKFNISSGVKSGAVVSAVSPGSSAAEAGIRPGDVILEANRTKIESVRRLSNMLSAVKGQVLLLVYRSGSTLYIVINT